ncbi:hypothetical protein STEG23_006145 [Scotinomys teguina]
MCSAAYSSELCNVDRGNRTDSRRRDNSERVLVGGGMFFSLPEMLADAIKAFLGYQLKRNWENLTTNEPLEDLSQTQFFRPVFQLFHAVHIPLSMNVSTFLAYDQPTISYCGVHHELLSHKPFETNAQEDTMESHLETELDLSTITSAGRISDHKPQLA